jgi:energy-converting hydrogenase Eha subunit F
MPRQNTATETRLNTITAYLTPALMLLDELNDAFGSSFVQPMSKTTLSLITAVQVIDSTIMICQW